MNHLKILLCLILIGILSSCSSKLLTVHKIDIQQGNALEAEAVNKVEIGMTQEQVKFLLGSPLITDSFHPGRWDYIYLFRPGYGKKERRQFTLIFDRGEVIEINKHNITNIKGDNVVAKDSIKEDQEAEEENKEQDLKEETLSEKDQEDLEEAEKQAEALEEVLQEN